MSKKPVFQFCSFLVIFVCFPATLFSNDSTQRAILQTKLERLNPYLEEQNKELHFLFKSEIVPDIIKAVAPIDEDLAKKYAESLSFDLLTQAYIEISKHQLDEEAIQTLNELKQTFDYLNTCLITICHEEFNRGFEQGWITINNLKNNSNTFIPSTQLELAQLLLKWNLEGAVETLEKAHLNMLEEIANETSTTFRHFRLMDLFKTEAHLSKALAFDTLKSLRKNTDRLQKENITNHSYSTEYHLLSAWHDIILYQLKNNCVSCEFDDDLENFLKVGLSQEQNFPEDSGFIPLLTLLIEELAVLDIQNAEQLLCHIPEKNYVLYLDAKIHGDEISLNQIIENEFSIRRKIWMYFNCFEGSEKSGLQNPLFYSEKAKNLILQNKNTVDLEDFFVSILKLEMEKGYFVQARQTLEELYKVPDSVASFDIDTVHEMVKAELALDLTFSNSKK